MKRIALVSAALSLFTSSSAFAMCGCFLPPRPPPSEHVADSRLTNKSSKVVIVHDGDRTVVSMANDFHGNAKEFAIVVPVPTEITREQIHIGDRDMIDSIGQATSPQFLEYPAVDPCAARVALAPNAGMMSRAEADRAGGGGGAGPAKPVTVKVEGSWTVGEYDVQVLAATDAGDLVKWLEDHDYVLPKGAEPVFASYLRQNMHFFLAKVNLSEQAKLGFTYLRPIQIAYESPKFMLPIRLGMLNAEDGEQELTVWTITQQGRVESTNYRTVKLTSVTQQAGMLPEYVKNDFEGTWRAMFLNAEKREGNDVVFLEYAGSGTPAMNPLGAPGKGLDTDTMHKLGVWWAGQAPAFVTRLHFTYDKEHFPEDLVLQQTSDQQPLQPILSVQDDPQTSACMSREQLRQSLLLQHEQQAQSLARLTGWDAGDILRTIDQGPDAKPGKHGLKGSGADDKKAWYQNLWK